MLGVIYHEGWFFGVDYSEAFRWLVLAATSGSADAQNKVACLYWLGHGVARNPEKAEIYWRKAASAGILEAAKNLDGRNNPEFKPFFGPTPQMPEVESEARRKRQIRVAILIGFVLLFIWSLVRGLRTPPRQPAPPPAEEAAEPVPPN
jgi:hypothetical protein